MAQLVARYVRDVEVAGSSPVTPTTFFHLLVVLFVGNLGGSPKLYKNECNYGSNWLVVKTVGTANNRDGIGARIAVEAGGARQIREIAAGSSSMSQNMMAAQFGLGKATKADLLTVRWPSGNVQTLADVPANQRLTVVEP